MRKVLIRGLLLGLILAALAGFALAAEAPDLSQKLRLATCYSGRRPALMTDGSYTSYWESHKMMHPWFTITSDEPVYGLYLCFRQMPSSFELQVPRMVAGGLRRKVTPVPCRRSPMNSSSHQGEMDTLRR